MDKHTDYKNIIYIVLVLILALTLSCSPKTIYIPVQSIQSEVEQNHSQDIHIDSISTSRLIYIKGDTVIDYVDRWHNKYIEKTDTLIVTKTDSISIPIEREKKLTRWQSIKIEIGGITLSMILILVIYVLYRIFKK